MALVKIDRKANTLGPKTKIIRDVIIKYIFMSSSNRRTLENEW